MASIVIGTIGSLIDHCYELTAYCDDARCRHHNVLDLEALAARLGRDHSSLRDKLVPKLRCSKCGGKRISLTVNLSEAERLKLIRRER